MDCGSRSCARAHRHDARRYTGRTSNDYRLLADLPAEVWLAVYVAIILGPIMITALTAAQGRFRPGARWVLLRGASEVLKRDIYRYRARAGIYSPAQTRTTSPAGKLSAAMGSALGGLMRTDVSQLPFDTNQPAPAANLGKLSAGGYVDERVTGQIGYYSRTAAKLVRGPACSGSWRLLLERSAFLAAIGAQVWVAIPTAWSPSSPRWSSLGSSRSRPRSTTRPRRTSASIRAWWQALPEPERETQSTIDRLVERAERIVRAEHVGWIGSPGRDDPVPPRAGERRGRGEAAGGRRRRFDRSRDGTGAGAEALFARRAPAPTMDGTPADKRAATAGTTSRPGTVE